MQQSNPTIAQVNRRIALARERAQRAVALADAAAFKQHAQIVRSGIKRASAVSPRMSSKGFGERDPRLALRIMRLLSVDEMAVYKFALIGVTSYKYHVSMLASKLVETSMYASPRSAAMVAAQAVRFLFEVAMEVGDASICKHLSWHKAQQMLQGRASRGTGVVAANEDAKELLATALAMCVQRIEKRVESEDEYEQEMSATAAATRA